MEWLREREQMGFQISLLPVDHSAPPGLEKSLENARKVENLPTPTHYKVLCNYCAFSFCMKMGESDVILRRLHRLLLQLLPLPPP